jgi:Protein of unknown function, DUF481
MRVLIVLAIAFAGSVNAWAQPRTDVVTLANGDRITGEIMELARGRLDLKTDDAGLVEIEWAKIARVQAVRQFEVMTSDGRRVLGSLSPATAPGFMVVVGRESSESLPIPEVTGIVPIGTSFWAKLDGSVDAGFSYTRSSGIAQTTLNSDTMYRRPDFAFQLMASATLTQASDGSQNDDRAALDGSYTRYRGARWFVVGGGRLETNESLGLVLRSQAGGGIGMRLVNTNRAQLRLGGGVVVNNEQGVDTKPTQNVEGVVTLTTSFYSYDRPKTDMEASLQYYPSLSDRGRRRLQFDSSLRRELWRDFFVAFNVFDSFDSRPPNADAAHNDVGAVASVGWSY